uniref:Uncharacterized protein n=1 Tax=Panagrolaimus sp. ES5 TaxID=591445 RepID=A0AC34GWL0_9BILA
MFSALNAIVTSEMQAIGFIRADSHDAFDVYVVDSITEKRVGKFEYQVPEIKDFLAEISKVEKFFKAFIIDLHELHLQKTPYLVSDKLCEELKEIFEQFGIQSYFVPLYNYHYSALLMAAEFDLKINEKVFLILHHVRREDQPENIFGITVGEFKFTPKGFQLISFKELVSLNSKDKPQNLRVEICGTKTPKNVITASFGSEMNPFTRIFKRNGINVFHHCCFACQFDKYIIETAKWLFDRTFIKYHILPTSAKGIHVYANYGTKTNILEIFKTDANELLPVTKTAAVTRSIPEFKIAFKTNSLIKTCTPDGLSRDGQRYRITVTINEENFENVTVGLLEIEDFEDLFEKVESKIPFIGFIDNSSVIAVYKPDEEQYEILDEWNDLIKIMSMSPEDIKVEKTWGFNFTSDERNPILLEFDNFDGTKKVATPSFLMALFLKQHLIIIKEETGEKPKEVALWIYDQDFDEVQMKRIKDGLQEACKLIKIDCSFVDSGNFEVNFIETRSIKIYYC